MKLIIVESPTKARTISKFLGKDFVVKSSQGHVRDLPKKEMGIDIENNFQPRYIIPTKAKTRVAELKEWARKTSDVILATDEDREGEAIAWHLAEALNLEKEKAERIVFHEITESAIKKALESPRGIDFDLVDAQQARRILDRLVGYELSPFLWKKIRRGLSAGRVQSVTLRFIVEREREIENFKKENYWNLNIELKKEKQIFSAELSEKNGEKIEKIQTLKLFAGDYKITKTCFSKEEEIEKTKKEIENSSLKVKGIERKEIFRNPSAPFTTSTLQQAAINQLGFSSKQTMSIAQKLYENGYITYMRTDSTNLSMQSMLSAQKMIEKKFGKKYALDNPRFFSKKSKGAQEAHEAIRPSDPWKNPDELKNSLEPREAKLYDLIWKRMIASQMAPAIFDSLKILVEARGEKNVYTLKANGSILKFDGFLKVYGNQKDVVLPDMKINDKLEINKIVSEKKFTQAPPRYTEASLVKILEENGIGRPSTYAPTISTIFERKYIDKNEEKRLYPLEIGLLVNDVLSEHFPQIMDTGFTAEIEKNLDLIAEGEKKWVPVIRDFYKPFSKNLKEKIQSVKKEDFQEKLEKKCPECGGDLVVKFGRFGKFVACSNFPNCRHTEKTEAEKKETEEIEKTNVIKKCELCGAAMVVKRGKFGMFLGCSNYPNCKNIKKIENKTGVKCPKCSAGDIVEKKSKRGKSFFGCNTYPKCDFALWNKPTGEKCPDCQSLLVFAAKGKIKCSNKECKFEKEQD
jgi:DNA topoisomerase-1